MISTTPTSRRYEYDIDKANEILDVIGWMDTDEDGIREDGAGNEIEFSLVTNNDNTVREKVTLQLQEGLERIGVKADYAQSGSALSFPRSPSPTTGRRWSSASQADRIHTAGIAFWHSSEALHLWHPNQSQPATEWEAEIDDLYIMGSQELDRDNAWRSITVPRKSPPTTCQSSTRRSPSG